MNHVYRRACRSVGLTLMLATVTPLAFAQTAGKDCKCRAPGGVMRDLGTVQCVDIAGRSKLVMCTMSTNTPYWKDVENGDGCPVA